MTQQLGAKIADLPATIYYPFRVCGIVYWDCRHCGASNRQRVRYMQLARTLQQPPVPALDPPDLDPAGPFPVDRVRVPVTSPCMGQQTG